MIVARTTISSAPPAKIRFRGLYSLSPKTSSGSSVPSSFVWTWMVCVLGSTRYGQLLVWSAKVTSLPSCAVFSAGRPSSVVTSSTSNPELSRGNPSISKVKTAFSPSMTVTCFASLTSRPVKAGLFLTVTAADGKGRGRMGELVPVRVTEISPSESLDASIRVRTSKETEVCPFLICSVLRPSSVGGRRLTDSSSSTRTSIRRGSSSFQSLFTTTENLPAAPSLNGDGGTREMLGCEMVGSFFTLTVTTPEVYSWLSGRSVTSRVTDPSLSV